MRTSSCFALMATVAVLTSVSVLPACVVGEASFAEGESGVGSEQDAKSATGGKKKSDAAGGGAEEETGDGPGDGGNAATGDCSGDADPLSPAALQKTLSFLASPELKGRQPGEPGDIATREFVEKRFRCLGLQPGGDNGGYLEKFTDSDDIASANTIGFIKGTDPVVGKEIIVLGAHQDHFGPQGSKTLRLGANDNASGTTMVIHLAEAIAKSKTPPRRTIAFMIFNSEEKGCEGSHHFVNSKGSANLPLANVVYDLNFDMVGTYHKYQSGRVDAHGSMAGSPANALLKEILGKPGAIKNMTVGKRGLGEDDSDFWPFCEVGIPMVAFFTDDENCYHKSCDTADKIDFPEMSQIGKVGLDLALGLSNGPTDLAAFRKNVKVSQLGCEGGEEGE